MNNPIAVISGHKVLEDDRTRWSVFCYLCNNLFGEPSTNAGDLEKTLAEHKASHKEETPE